MTQEEKRLLYKDLSARQPYRPFVCFAGKLIMPFLDIFATTKDNDPISINGLGIEYVKSYLRPLSSMTEKEKEELKKEHNKDERIYIETLERIANGDEHARGTAVPHFAADWCNEHHFDYRGLIPMGLALKAKEGMYKTSNG